MLTNRNEASMDTSPSQYFGKDLHAMSFAVNYHQWILEEFCVYLGKDVAEVGAGSGTFSELILEYVNHLVVFEPSDNMYPILQARFSQNTQVDTVHSTLCNECTRFQHAFDSMLYVNVLEHIEDDQQELAYMYQTLRHGGYALIFVPALPCLYSNFDRNLGHFRRYRKKSLVRMAEQSGFQIQKARYFDIAGVIPWYINFVLLQQTITAGKVLFYDKWIVPIMRRIERVLPPPVGKNLLVVMKKP